MYLPFTFIFCTNFKEFFYIDMQQINKQPKYICAIIKTSKHFFLTKTDIDIILIFKIFINLDN